MNRRLLRPIGIVSILLCGCGGGGTQSGAVATPSSTGAVPAATSGGATGAPPAGVMYADGAYDTKGWPNDYSWGTILVDSKLDTTHPQPGHTYDLQFSSNDGGGWQPATDWTHNGVDLSPYTYMQFDVYPASGALIDWHWIYIGKIVPNQGNQDIPTSAYVPDISYFGKLTPNAWNTVKLPMAAVGNLLDTNVYKFSLRDNRGTSSQPLFFDNVKWVAGSVAFAYGGDSGPASGWSDASVNVSVDYAVDPTVLSSRFVSLNGMIGTSGVTRKVAKLSTPSSGGQLKLGYAGGFAVSSFDHFTFGAYPTRTPQSYRVQFYDTSGAPVGSALDPSAYTPSDMGAGSFQWTVYCIPLSAFGALPASIGAVSITDSSGSGANTIYLSAIGFYN